MYYLVLTVKQNAFSNNIKYSSKSTFETSIFIFNFYLFTETEYPKHATEVLMTTHLHDIEG